MTSCSIVVNSPILALVQSYCVRHLHEAGVRVWEEAGGDVEERDEVDVKAGNEGRSGGSCYREVRGRTEMRMRVMGRMRMRMRMRMRRRRRSRIRTRIRPWGLIRRRSVARGYNWHR